MGANFLPGLAHASSGSFPGATPPSGVTLLIPRVQSMSGHKPVRHRGMDSGYIPRKERGSHKSQLGIPSRQAGLS
jgi:hypothetical protein